MLRRAAAVARADIGRARRILGLADEAAELAIGCHPEEVNSHYAAGIAALMHVRLGFRDRLAGAEKALDEALRRNPLFAPLLQSRLEAAQIRGDREQVLSFSKRLERIKSLK